MDFFNNVGSGELLILALLALLLFGPEDLIKIMRTLKDYTEQARRAWTRLSAELEHDVLSDELQALLQETQAPVMDARQELEDITNLQAEEPPSPATESEPRTPPVHGP